MSTHHANSQSPRQGESRSQWLDRITRDVLVKNLHNGLKQEILECLVKGMTKRQVLKMLKEGGLNRKSLVGLAAEAFIDQVWENLDEIVVEVIDNELGENLELRPGTYLDIIEDDEQQWEFPT